MAFDSGWFSYLVTHNNWDLWFTSWGELMIQTISWICLRWFVSLYHGKSPCLTTIWEHIFGSLFASSIMASRKSKECVCSGSMGRLSIYLHWLADFYGKCRQIYHSHGSVMGDRHGRVKTQLPGESKGRFFDLPDRWRSRIPDFDFRGPPFSPTVTMDKINPKDCQVSSPLVIQGFSNFFRVVSSDYGKPWFRTIPKKGHEIAKIATLIGLIEIHLVEVSLVLCLFNNLLS